VPAAAQHEHCSITILQISVVLYTYPTNFLKNFQETLSNVVHWGYSSAGTAELVKRQTKHPGEGDPEPNKKTPAL
jgi:trehalose utilization protein